MDNSIGAERIDVRSTASSHARWPDWRAAALITLAGVLLLAAALKSYALLAYPSSGIQYWLSLVLVCGEIGLGVWLTVSPRGAASWGRAIGVKVG